MSLCWETFPPLSSTILCVDDDPGFCRILARAFREQGYQVETAHDGESALQQIRASRPDLVTLDIMLPRLDGFAVLKAIRTDGEDHLPVILLSGARTTPEYDARAKDLLVDALLTKPVPLKRLLAVVGKIAPKADGGPARPVDLSGSFAELPFPVLLHHLHGMRATGVLRVQNKKKKKLVQLRNGQLVSVRSNMVKETLGHLLVSSGTIGWDALHESVRRVKEGEGLQGQILKAMFMLDDEDLARALHNQSEQKLLEVFEWSQGTYRFQQGARIRGEAAGLKCTPATLILEGVRDRTPIDAIDDYLAEKGELYPVPSGSPFHVFQSLEVDAALEDVIGLADGSESVASLAEGDEERRRMLFGLIATGHVELEHARAKKLQLPRGRVAAERVHVVDGRAEGKHLERVRSELTELAERFQGEDAFAMFGLPKGADDLAIRRAYAELARRTHPDRYGTDGDVVRRLAEEVFDRVTRAYHSIATEADRQRTERERRENEDLEEGQQALRAELAFQRGEKAMRAGFHREALSHFSEAVEAYPEEGEYHAAYAWALYLEDPSRLVEAKKCALKGKKLAPDRSAPLLVLGRLCKVEEKAALAEKLFTKAVELDPDCADALQELRLIALRKRNNQGLIQRILKRASGT